jgi:hypothetical protein
MLPKQYGGGMKKTFFLNATQITDLAANWYLYYEKYQISINTKKNIKERKAEFLTKNATKIERSTTKPTYFFKIAQEMCGKHGWFDSTYKNYKMTEYFSGWEFPNQEKHNEFLNIR